MGLLTPGGTESENARTARATPGKSAAWRIHLVSCGRSGAGLFHAGRRKRSGLFSAKSPCGYSSHRDRRRIEPDCARWRRDGSCDPIGPRFQPSKSRGASHHRRHRDARRDGGTRGTTCRHRRAGIPGTIGGALRMNGGAYGSETKDFLIESHGVDRQGNLRKFSNGEMDFSYRHCGVPEDVIFTIAVLQGQAGQPEDIAAEMAAIKKKR